VQDSRERRRQVRAWAFYDWANSAFATTVMAGFFPVFFQQYWSVGVAPTTSTARLGVANSIAGFCVALLAPILGAVADSAGRRKPFLLWWAAVGVLSTAGLFWVGRGDWVSAFWLFIGGTIGFSAANVFYDALLVDVASPADYDRVSSLGYALGYLGGGLLFLVNVVMVSQPAWFGLQDAAQAVQLSFLTVAIWWAVFTLPLARRVVESLPAAPASLPQAAVAGFRELAGTLRSLPRYRELALFLLAYWLYIDGVNTIIKMAVDYGVAIGLPANALMTALLLTQFVAFPAALWFGRFADRRGARNGILLGLAVYTAATLYAFFLDTVTEFYALAVAIGLVQGGVQSLSRSFFGRLVPPGHSGEFFGFYNMMGKFATVVGPLLVAAVAYATGSSRASIVSLVLLFVIGGLLLLLVREPGNGATRGAP
jgi:UMF1 family MFS transporter